MMRHWLVSDNGDVRVLPSKEEALAEMYDNEVYLPLELPIYLDRSVEYAAMDAASKVDGDLCVCGHCPEHHEALAMMNNPKRRCAGGPHDFHCSCTGYRIQEGLKNDSRGGN